MTTTRTLYCEVGKHDFQVESKRGRPPRNCPEHTIVKAPVAKIVELYCENGKHSWEAPNSRGRNPKNCPEHKNEAIAQKVKAHVYDLSIDELQAGREMRIIEVLGLRKSRQCKCGISPKITDEELIGLGTGCADTQSTHPRDACPTLAKIRQVAYGTGDKEHRVCKTDIGYLYDERAKSYGLAA
jgi:hypothetical protein